MSDRISPESGSYEGEAFADKQRAYIKIMVEKLLEKGIFAVYGDEDKTAEPVSFDEDGRREICRPYAAVWCLP